MGEEEEKRSRIVKQKKEEMKGCFEVMKLKKLRSEVYQGMSNIFFNSLLYCYSFFHPFFLLSMYDFFSPLYQRHNQIPLCLFCASYISVKLLIFHIVAVCDFVSLNTIMSKCPTS